MDLPLEQKTFHYDVIKDMLNSKCTKTGTTQLDLQAGTGISKSKISRVIAGESILNSIEIYQVASFFSVPPDWMYTEHLQEVTLSL